MKLQSRLWPVLFMGIALAAIIILSAGINDLEFLPGKPFRIGFESEGTAGEAMAGRDDFALTLFRILLVGYLACIPIVFFLISPQKRKRVLLFLLSLFFIFAFLDRITVYLINVMRDALQLPTGMLISLPGLDSGGSIIQFTPSAPQWITVIVSTGVALLIVITIFFIVRRFFILRSPLADPVRNAAQDALEALRQGTDFKETVVNCYREMGRVLITKRGITRTKDMTPREFETSLLPTSLPHEALSQLTRLFEEIRYGNKTPGEKENQKAIRCLRAIIKACETEQ